MRETPRYFSGTVGQNVVFHSALIFVIVHGLAYKATEIFAFIGLTETSIGVQ